MDGIFPLLLGSLRPCFILIIFKFMIPESALRGKARVNTVFSPEQDKLLVPAEQSFDEELFRRKSVEQQQEDEEGHSRINSEVDEGADPDVRNIYHDDQAFDIAEMQALGEFRSEYKKFHTKTGVRRS